MNGGADKPKVVIMAEVSFPLNSDNIVFDQEMLMEPVYVGFRAKEVPVPARYFPEASSERLYPERLMGRQPRQMLSECGSDLKD